jgi:hypothetical protein
VICANDTIPKQPSDDQFERILGGALLGIVGGLADRYWDVEVWEKGWGGEEEGGVQKVLERGSRRPRKRKRGMEQRIVSRIR